MNRRSSIVAQNPFKPAIDFPGLCAQGVTVMAIRKSVPSKDGAWDAVVTAGGRDKYFVRRRKDRLHTDCPLLCCEVRRDG